MGQTKEFSLGCMPHTDFRYEEFEGLLASFYLTYEHFSDSSDQIKKEAFAKLNTILDSFANRYNLQTPKDAIKNVRSDEDWGKPSKFRSYWSTKDMLGSFWKDFGVTQNSQEDIDDLKSLATLIQSIEFVF